MTMKPKTKGKVGNHVHLTLSSALALGKSERKSLRDVLVKGKTSKNKTQFEGSQRSLVISPKANLLSGSQTKINVLNSFQKVL